MLPLSPIPDNVASAEQQPLHNSHPHRKKNSLKQELIGYHILILVTSIDIISAPNQAPNQPLNVLTSCNSSFSWAFPKHDYPPHDQQEEARNGKRRRRKLEIASAPSPLRSHGETTSPLLSAFLAFEATVVMHIFAKVVVSI